MRYFIEIAYHGKNYHGWQIQPDAISVQEVLESTLSILLRKEIKVAGAGRTDTGVHAKQLFAHFDCEPIENLSEVVFRLNSFLPKDISVKNIHKVTADAHARFNATGREYEYVITTEKSPFLEELAYHVYQKPDIEKMNEAAELLLNYKDFQCFSRSNSDVKTYHCKLVKAIWTDDNTTLIFTIKADRFLRNMVRAVVGTLLEVGYGKLTIEDIPKIIESKDRSKAGASAPAHGLYLSKVEYPEHIFLKE